MASTFLFVLAVIAFLLGFSIMDSAKSAIHEIDAFILYLIGAVFFSGSAIVSAVNNAAEKFEINSTNNLPTSQKEVQSKSLEISECDIRSERDADSIKIDSEKLDSYLCPKCNVSMQIKTVTKGEHKGKQFYVCSNCREMKEV